MNTLKLIPVVEHEVLQDQTLEMIKGGAFYDGWKCSGFSCGTFDGETCSTFKCEIFVEGCKNLYLDKCQTNCTSNMTTNG